MSARRAEPTKRVVCECGATSARGRRRRQFAHLNYVRLCSWRSSLDKCTHVPPAVTHDRAPKHSLKRREQRAAAFGSAAASRPANVPSSSRQRPSTSSSMRWARGAGKQARVDGSNATQGEVLWRWECRARARRRSPVRAVAISRGRRAARCGKLYRKCSRATKRPIDAIPAGSVRYAQLDGKPRRPDLLRTR